MRKALRMWRIASEVGICEGDWSRQKENHMNVLLPNPRKSI